MEEIKNEIVSETVEQTLEAAAEAVTKKPSLGKKIGKTFIVISAIALVGMAAKTVYTKIKGSKKEDQKPESEVADNVEIAKRDFLEEDETEE